MQHNTENRFYLIYFFDKISGGFSDISDFLGVCVVTPFQISSVSVQIIFESQEGLNEDNFQNRLRDIALNRFNLPEGFRTRDPSLITVKGKTLDMK